MTAKVRDLLGDRYLFSVVEHMSVLDVAKEMANRNVGAILVLADGKLRGVFSERDLMARVVLERRDPAATRVKDVMSTNLATVEESATLDDAMEMMQRYKCRHLPVMRGSEVVGFLSMRDLMKVELEDKIEELQHLHSYVSGAG